VTNKTTITTTTGAEQQQQHLVEYLQTSKFKKKRKGVDRRFEMGEGGGDREGGGARGGG
jgi:hypothetical protein